MDSPEENPSEKRGVNPLYNAPKEVVEAIGKMTGAMLRSKHDELNKMAFSAGCMGLCYGILSRGGRKPDEPENAAPAVITLTMSGRIPEYVIEQMEKLMASTMQDLSSSDGAKHVYDNLKDPEAEGFFKPTDDDS